MRPQEKTARARHRALSPSRQAITFAARCSLLRRALHLTQKEFGRKLGRTALTISRWERIAGHAPSLESSRRFVEVEYEYKIRAGDPRPRLKLGGTT